MIEVRLTGWHPADPPTISLRCPICRQVGTFDTQPAKDWHAGSDNTLRVGSRKCPNPACSAHVFVVFSTTTESLVATYPPETIDFDASNLPKAVHDSLDEAIRAHAAQCYRAAALMVRRTLEDLCADRGASGQNLKDRLKALHGRIAVADALVDGLDSLRLLGNDAAHVELKDFDTIGQSESSLAIEIAKELLKGVYQYDDLVARLEALKKQP